MPVVKAWTHASLRGVSLVHHDYRPRSWLVAAALLGEQLTKVVTHSAYLPRTTAPSTMYIRVNEELPASQRWIYSSSRCPWQCQTGHPSPGDNATLACIITPPPHTVSSGLSPDPFRIALKPDTMCVISSRVMQATTGQTTNRVPISA